MSDNHVNPDVAVETFVLELLDGPPFWHGRLRRVSTGITRGRAPAGLGPRLVLSDKKFSD
jgi:hypothetical protein